MIQALLFAAAVATTPAPAAAPTFKIEHPSTKYPGEEEIADYAHAPANAGTTPFEGDGMWKAFHEKAGVDRVVDELVDRSLADPRISDIFKSHDMVRLRRTLKEQFCYLLNGGCDYSGRDMKTVHKDMGLQNTDFNALVEHLQVAMDHEKIGFRDQNRFLAKLAPMQRQAVER
ncbi:group 1 truncated hemoglobin [Phenylobacterium sp.]|jgi:hemoglobin|uniref:group I truncated hemoglobin n=1 Tax=Phenylobacterium sp. TaxID=1871053 RepID=UPI0012280ED5|nr:group 1 truncated hemoglobin [Phenylobacterium sp.]THD71126.1 MAG: group 1 truncated hemoglobin [Phenylobacterium sp.]